MLPVVINRSSSDDSAMLCTSRFVDDAMFSHNGAHTDARWQWLSTSDPSSPALTIIDSPAACSIWFDRVATQAALLRGRGYVCHLLFIMKKM